MKFIVEVEFSEEIMERVSQMSPADRAHFLANKIEDGLEGGYYEQVDATMIGSGGAFVSSWTDQIRAALIDGNPNDSSTEIWDDEAIQELANYVEGNGWDLDELPDDLYAMYDLLKWTIGNK